MKEGKRQRAEKAGRRECGNTFMKSEAFDKKALWQYGRWRAHVVLYCVGGK